MLLAATILPLLAAWGIDPHYPGDDALISLCFARNLAEGHGFVFNHPPPVLGTTSPLFTLTVALISATGSLQPIMVAFALSIAAWIGLIWIFFFFRKAFGIPALAAALIGVLVAGTGWVEHLSMEAYPFALVEVLTVALLFSGKPLAGGLAGGCLFLLRGEGILFASLAGLVPLLSEFRNPAGNKAFSPTLAYVGGLAFPLFAWALYAVPQFGSILPDTLAAKMAQVSSGLWAPFPVRLFSRWLPGWGLGFGPHALRFLLGWSLVLLGIFRIVRKYNRMWISPVWAVAYALGYSLLGVPGYPWYRLPILLVLTLCAALGLELLFHCCVGGEEIRWRRATGRLLLAVILLPPLLACTDRIRASSPSDRDLAYRELARYFAENADPDESIAYMEVGYLGYYTRLGIVDLVGLVSPSLIPYVIRRDFSSGFWESRPDYLVELEGSEFIRPIVQDPRFPQQYYLLKELPGFDGRGLRIYHRR